MSNIYCIGELLIDFISEQQNVTLEEATTFSKKAGGAPANVTVAARNLGVPTYFLGQVGQDAFGRFLVDTLKQQQVDTSYIRVAGNTTLAFVSLASDGERSFEFFRGSDGEYTLHEEIQLTRSDVVHFGSATALLPGELKTSYYRLLDMAIQKNSFISFDPNYRDLLVEDLEGFRQDCYHFMKHAHLVKLSDEEALLLTQTTSLEEALEVLRGKTEALITITRGALGTMAVYNNDVKMIPSIKVDVVDTTGAGDCFIGTLLGGIAQLEEVHQFPKLVTRDEMIKYANIAAALTCTKYGAIPALPTREEIEARQGVTE
ncbi:MAG: carbohydrate kinase family protein [Culicoidibacterales bacterium]